MLFRLAVFFFLLSQYCVAEDLPYFNVSSQESIRGTEPFRYIPQNIMDNHPETVFAVHGNTLNKKLPLFVVKFSSLVSADEFWMKPGYFDARYFKANNRLKDVRIELVNDNRILKDTISTTFPDQMIASSVKLPLGVRFYEIRIYVDSVYPCEKWDDLCISDIGFLSGGENMRLVPNIVGSRTYKDGSGVRYTWTGERMTRKQSWYGHAGGEDEHFTYDSSGKLVFSIDEDMEHTWHRLYFYSAGGQLETGIEYDESGNLTNKISYFWQGNQQIKLVSRGRTNYATENSTLGDRLVTTKTTRPDDGSEWSTEYLFAQDKLIGERISTTYSVNGKKQVTEKIYRYDFDEFGRVTKKTCVNDDPTGGSEAIWSGKYDNGHLVEETWTSVW